MTDVRQDVAEPDTPLVSTAAGNLTALLRVRPSTREQARELLAVDDADAAVDALVAAGLLHEREGLLEYLDPDTAVTAWASSLLEREQRRLADLAGLVNELPELARAWRLGESPEGRQVQGELTRGHDAALERWFELAAQLTPGLPCAAIPDMGWIHAHVAPRVEELGAAFSAGGYEVRYLFPASALDDPRDLAAIDGFVEIGVSVRVSPRIPSWFYVDHRTMSALPLAWGDRSPEGMAILRSSAVIAAMQTLFDSLWVSASPYPSTGRSWQSVLELMGRGRTDEQIARHLGIGVRTVRRRISDAMDDLGVSSRFELGAAWAGLSR